MKFKKSILFLLLLLAFNTNTIHASSVEKLREDKNDKKQQITEQQNRINELSEQIKIEEKNVQTIDEDVARLQNLINELNENVIILEKKIDATIVVIKRIKDDIDVKKKKLASRLRTNYMTSKTSYLEVILKSKDINDLINRTNMIQNIVVYDTDLIDSLKDNKLEMEKRNIELKDNKKELNQNKYSIEVQQSELKVAVQAKEELIKKYKENVEYAEKIKAQMKAESDAIDSRIREEVDKQRRAEAEKRAKNEGGTPEQYLTNHDASQVGAMRWPVSSGGVVTSEFGSRSSPFAAIGNFHTGLDIAAPMGTAVIAAQSGTVVHSGWYGGYGNCVILSHGGGVFTLYGHGSSVTVSNGQSVNAGDTILLIGSTGYSTGPHLHFEVRLNGNFYNNAVNPRNFL